MNRYVRYGLSIFISAMIKWHRWIATHKLSRSRAEGNVSLETQQTLKLLNWAVKLSINYVTAVVVDG